MYSPYEAKPTKSESSELYIKFIIFLSGQIMFELGVVCLIVFVSNDYIILSYFLSFSLKMIY